MAASTSSDPLLLDGSDSGGGGRDTAVAAQSVDGASSPLGAGSTAGGADAARTQHAPAVDDLR